MKTQYVAARELGIDGKIIKKGEPLITAETPEGIPAERAINAIARGFAVPQAETPVIETSAEGAGE